MGCISPSGDQGAAVPFSKLPPSLPAGAEQALKEINFLILAQLPPSLLKEVHHPTICPKSIGLPFSLVLTFCVTRIGAAMPNTPCFLLCCLSNQSII